VHLAQLDGGGSRDRDALVRRAEQHVGLEVVVDDRLGIEATERGQAGTGVDRAGVEEVRRRPPGLQREAAEPQHVVLQGELDELAPAHVTSVS
jgi:hypothetical protein